MAQDFEKLNIQWFPGHMTKAQRMIEEHMKHRRRLLHGYLQSHRHHHCQP